ncbi:hypothetical protein PCE1_001954 [Barthelona sp. PCE]
MPRVRKFEEDLVMQAYPDGQMIFEGEGVVLLKSREITEISLIESAIEGKDFIGYVEDTRKPLQYTSKLKAGESYMIIEQLFDDSGIITHFDILLFNDVMNEEHTRRIVPFPFPMIKSLSSGIVPLDENHLLFAIKETVDNRQLIQCYILNVITYDYRCLGEYYSISVRTPNYILLRYCQDNFIWHYNFSVDDMDEAHEPDIEQLHGGVHLSYISCLNSDCICSVSFDNYKVDELVIFDSQRNQVNLTERFPQLKGLNIYMYSNFALLTLTQDVLLMLLIGFGSSCVVIHIENGELKISEVEMNFKNVLCHSLKHIDLNDSSFRKCSVLFGEDRRTGRYGPIKFREVSKEVLRLNSLQPKRIFFDGIEEVYGHIASIRCYFFFKERKLIVLRGCRKPFSRVWCQILSVHPNEGDDFFVMAEKHSETNTYVKLCWTGSEFKPITTILPHCGSKNRGFIQGLPLNVDYREDTELIYLGEKVILELPPNNYIRSVYGSHFDNSACILCEEAIHFFQLNVNGYDVEVQKHIVFEHEYLYDVYFNPSPLAETPDHQLFVVCTHSRVATTQHLHCLDWSTGSFLEPVHLYQNSMNEKIEEGNYFNDFVGDSYIHVRGGIIKAYIEACAIKTRFYTNNNLQYSPDMKISHDPNLPNNVIQDMSYEEETKTMVLKTYNVEEDPESMNPTVERFHLPSFLAEASIFEYHMPDYHEHYHNE